MNRLTNLKWISFKISTSKNFTRLIKYDDNELVSFKFNIVEGQFDLSQLMQRKDLDQFNRKCIEIGIMENKYLNRRPYFYMTALVLMETLVLMDMEGNYKSKEILSIYYMSSQYTKFYMKCPAQNCYSTEHSFWSHSSCYGSSIYLN